MSVISAKTSFAECVSPLSRVLSKRKEDSPSRNAQNSSTKKSQDKSYSGFAKVRSTGGPVHPARMDSTIKMLQGGSTRTLDLRHAWTVS